MTNTLLRFLSFNKYWTNLAADHSEHEFGVSFEGVSLEDERHDAKTSINTVKLEICSKVQIISVCQKGELCFFLESGKRHKKI